MTWTNVGTEVVDGIQVYFDMETRGFNGSVVRGKRTQTPQV